MTEKIIWDCLKAQGLSDYGTAGLMGNLKAESGPNPTNLQNSFERKLGYTDASYTAAVDNGTYTNFVHDGAGYGLAQWTYWSRKQGLLDYARTAGKSIGDTKMQVGYLVFELKKYGLWEALMAATSVREASDIIMLRYEKPASIYTADREKSLEKRAGFGQEYYEKYAKRGGNEGMKYTAANPPMQCFMRQSTWYKSVGATSIRGVLWHSTGANNPYISRYVQPDDNAPDRDKIIAVLGRNKYGNDWNHQALKKGVHAFIGKLTNGEVSTVQTGPWNKKAWGCGPGKKGSCNSGWIQFEMCEDGLDDPDYFQKVYREAVELTAYLCKIHGLDPRGTVNFCGVKTPVILCHQDSYRIGLGGNHGDVYTWFNQYGKTMDDVRNDVAALLEGTGEGKEEDGMTKAEVLQIIKEYEAQRDAARAQAGPSDWSKAARAWAESNGIISGTGAGMQYKATCTREQVVQLLYRAAHLLERK
ncbi:MAG: N-acetylmuramoyl-L-alanine amidase [Lawsonibacter sp.]|mgnify:CR=1 FL=1|nr:N-acetylmuramoyl-L-alanine amidase [Lawsonibacter sp.]